MSTMRWCIDEADVNRSGKNRFEIKGWIWSKKGNAITAEVKDSSGQDIPYRISWINRPDVQKYLKIEDSELKLGFIIYIDDISKLWEKKGEIEVKFSDSVETVKVFQREWKDIKQRYIKNLIKYHVDSACILEDYVLIKGWAFYKKERCPVFVLDSQDNEIEFTCEREIRPDVNDIFSVDSELESGFTIKFPKKCLENGNVAVTFKSKDSRARYVLSAKKLYFSNSKVGKYYEQLGPKKLRSNYQFIRAHGMKEFKKQLSINLNPNNQGYGYWAKLHKTSKQELKRQRQTRFPYEPLISIVIPLYNTPLNYFDDLLRSVVGQTYSNWQLCFADGSPNDRIEKFLQEKYKKEKRIVYKRLEKNEGISENTNAALKLADGEYIMLSDHDDVLEVNALYEIVKALNTGGHPDIVYTDEDKVTMDGKEYFDPHFKPDFNWNLLRSNNYICHIFVVSKKIVDQIGEFRKEYDGAQDFDFILRCCEKANCIYHIPKVLYHWRSHPNSTAGNPASKMYAYENGRKAVEAHYKRIQQDAEVTMTPYWGRYRSKLKHKGTPLVSIIIPNKDHIDDLDRCIKSIYEISTYKNFEILIVENNSSQQETFAYYEQIQQTRKNLKVLYWKEHFNYAAINNFGVKYAQGDFFIFLNNDIEVITPEWMEEMLGYCQREEVGIVGAKLYYPNDTVQHAGVVIGMGADHAAGHVFYGVDRKQFTYGGRANSTQDISAVTAACMMVKRSVHEDIGGFDENFEVAFNDVDYCLRVRELGKTIIFHGFVELYHYESRSRGLEDTPEKKERFNREAGLFRKRWKSILDKGDPYYNPNLTLEDSNCTLKW